MPLQIVDYARMGGKGRMKPSSTKDQGAGTPKSEPCRARPKFDTSSPLEGR